jgi:hypothetical protein
MTLQQWKVVKYVEYYLQYLSTSPFPLLNVEEVQLELPVCCITNDHHNPQLLIRLYIII